MSTLSGSTTPVPTYGAMEELKINMDDEIREEGEDDDDRDWAIPTPPAAYSDEKWRLPPGTALELDEEHVHLKSEGLTTLVAEELLKKFGKNELEDKTDPKWLIVSRGVRVGFGWEGAMTSAWP